ncbi:hypothetical protein INR49_009864, partial [Caranx melampygus]
MQLSYRPGDVDWQQVSAISLSATGGEGSSLWERDNSWICIGSSDGLYVVELATSELLTALYFKDYPNLSIAMAGSWSISPGQDNSLSSAARISSECRVEEEEGTQSSQKEGDGKQILCGLGDSSVLLYKSSLTGNPAVYTGHNKPVRSVCWNLNRQWWLSASEDQTLRVWTHDSTEPAIIMDDSLFSKPIRGAQFYYLDKFLLFASGPSLYLYLYNVDTTRDSIKRYQQRSFVKLASRLTTSSVTDITALSAVNDFFSYRSIQVFDMNRSVVASKLPDAQSRAIHCITQNKGSMFSTQAPESYNLFLTSAVTDGVKIWDLRTLRCVRRYENHLNRCHPCSSAISPCGQFIASGSEDNCAYVYDVRSSSYLHKLQKQSDTVLSVAFNPAKPELLTGTLDGKLRLFQSSSGACLSHDTSAAVHSVLSTT